jgi:hypothetical protein
MAKLPPVGIFDSKIVLFVAAEHVIIEAALGATNLEAGEYGIVRTAIVGHLATIQVGAYLGVNVNNAAGSETELSGE